MSTPAAIPFAWPRTWRGRALRWSDWLVSVMLHALLLAGGMGLLATSPSAPSVQTLEMPMRWAATPAPAAPEPPAAAPAPPPPPPPPPRRAPAPPARRTVQPAVPQRTAIAAPAPQPPSATPVQAAPQPVAPGPAIASEPQGKAGKAAWRNAFDAMLRRYKQFPPMARRMRQQGTVWVQAAFSPEGVLLECHVVESSGVAVLDDAAIRLVRQAAAATTASAPPGSPLRLKIPIAYVLKEE